MTKGVVTCNLYKRKGSPSVNAEKLGYFVSGDEVEIEEVVLGETENDYYEGIPTWYKLINGIYVWSGGVSINSKEKINKDNQNILKKISTETGQNKKSGELNIRDFVTTQVVSTLQNIKC